MRFLCRKLSSIGPVAGEFPCKLLQGPICNRTRKGPSLAGSAARYCACVALQTVLESRLAQALAEQRRVGCACLPVLLLLLDGCCCKSALPPLRGAAKRLRNSKSVAGSKLQLLADIALVQH